jgi:hypothetical protein
VSDPETPKTPAAAVQMVSRRRLAFGALGGLTLVGLGGLGLAMQRTRRPAPPSQELRVLTLDEHAIVSAVAARTCSPPGPDVPGADALEVGLLADRFLARCPDEQIEDVKTVLAIFESGLVGALVLQRTSPFTQLGDADQDRVLLAWRDSSVLLERTIARALMGLTTSLYFGHPRAWPSLGYLGPPDHAALRRAYADQLVELDQLRAPGHEIEGA